MGAIFIQTTVGKGKFVSEVPASRSQCKWGFPILTLCPWAGGVEARPPWSHGRTEIGLSGHPDTQEMLMFSCRGRLWSPWGGEACYHALQWDSYGLSGPVHMSPWLQSECSQPHTYLPATRCLEPASPVHWWFCGPLGMGGHGKHLPLTAI